MNIEELENDIKAIYNPTKRAVVFGIVWVNFDSYVAPTTEDIIRELQMVKEVRSEIESITRETPYEFAEGVVDRNNNNATSRHPAVSTNDRFTPSVLYEGDTMRMSIGLAHKDTETPF